MQSILQPMLSGRNDGVLLHATLCGLKDSVFLRVGGGKLPSGGMRGSFAPSGISSTGLGDLQHPPHETCDFESTRDERIRSSITEVSMPVMHCVALCDCISQP